MEATENTELEVLRDLICALAMACTDAALLDLLCKLLAQG